jgi:hypothetical protein
MALWATMREKNYNNYNELHILTMAGGPVTPERRRSRAY